LARSWSGHSFEVALGFAAQEIADAAVDVRPIAGDAEQRLAAAIDLGPHRAAHATTMRDSMRLAAQGHDHAIGEWRGARQPIEPRGNPRAVLLRKLARLLESAARWNRQHDFARRRLDAQRVAPRLAMSPHAHEVDRPVKDDLDGLRLSRTAIEQRAQRHDHVPRIPTQRDSATSIAPCSPLAFQSRGALDAVESA
jgi:hypothetical protein